LFPKGSNKNPLNLVPYSSTATLHPYWVTGFTEGDGSFSLNLSLRKSSKLPQFGPRFTISQNSRDAALMGNISNFFGCGSLTGGANSMLYYRVSGTDQLRIIVPHFIKYPC